MFRNEDGGLTWLTLFQMLLLAVMTFLGGSFTQFSVLILDLGFTLGMTEDDCIEDTPCMPGMPGMPGSPMGGGGTPGPGGGGGIPGPGGGGGGTGTPGRGGGGGGPAMGGGGGGGIMGVGMGNDEGGLIERLGFENDMPSVSVVFAFKDSVTQGASATPILLVGALGLSVGLIRAPFSVRGVSASFPFPVLGVLPPSARPRSVATDLAISRSPSLRSLSAYSFFSRSTVL